MYTGGTIRPIHIFQEVLPMTDSERIERLEAEVSRLSFELQSLRNEVSKLQDTRRTHTHVMPGISATQKEIFKQTSDLPKKEKMQKKKRNGNWESLVGTLGMSLAASVLVFVSLFLFAGMLAPMLTKTMKVTAMYLVSIFLIAAGCFKMKQESKYHHFFAALTGCGTGCLYLSLLITYFYFHLLNSVMLSLFILGWLLLLIWLRKTQEIMFGYI